MTFKTSAQRILAYVQSPPMQVSYKILEGYWTKVHQICSRRIFFVHNMRCDQSTRCQMTGAAKTARTSVALRCQAGYKTALSGAHTPATPRVHLPKFPRTVTQLVFPNFTFIFHISQLLDYVSV